MFDSIFSVSYVRVSTPYVTIRSFCRDHETTDPDRSPRDIVAEEELLDINAVCNETFQSYSVHLDGVSEYDQLFTKTVVYYEINSVGLISTV